MESSIGPLVGAWFLAPIRFRAILCRAWPGLQVDLVAAQSFARLARQDAAATRRPTSLARAG